MKNNWKPIDELDKSDYQFVLIYDDEQDIVRLMLWNPSTKQWENPPADHGNVSHFMEIPKTPKTKDK